MGIVAARLGDDQEKRLRDLAQASGLPLSAIFRRALERELADSGAPARADEQRNGRIRELELYAFLTRPDVKDRHRREFGRRHAGAKNAHLRPPEPKRPKSLRFQLTLPAEEVLAVEHHSQAFGLKPAQFCTVLIRQWLGLRKAPPADTARALSLIRSELRRIGVNINQIARAANEFARPTERTLRDRGAMTADELAQGVASLPAQVKALEGLTAEIDRHMGRERRYLRLGTSDQQDVDLHPSVAEPTPNEQV